MHRPLEADVTGQALQEGRLSIPQGGQEDLAHRVSYGSDLSVAVSHTKTKPSLELVSPEKDQIVSMKSGTPLSPSSVLPDEEDFPEPTHEQPWTVPQAAKFLGVSPQTVYL